MAKDDYKGEVVPDLPPEKRVLVDTEVPVASP